MSGIEASARFIAQRKLDKTQDELYIRLQKYQVAKGRSLLFERAECLRLLEIVLECKCVLNIDKTDDLEIKEMLLC